MPDLYLDVSHYQGVPDYGAVAAAGIKGVIAKLGGGDAGLYVDSQFSRNWQEIEKHGMVRGAYWFANPANGYGAEASYFLGHLPVLSPGDIVALDLETGGGDPHGYAIGWLSQVEKATGRIPWIYGNAYDLEAFLKVDAYFARFPLWVAGYVPKVKIPRPWKAYTAWQFTSSAHVPGISGNVDQSYVVATQGGTDMSKQDALDALNEGTAQGQPDWPSTNKALVATVQGLVNDVAEIKAAVAGGTGGSLPPDVADAIKTIASHLK